MVQGLGRAQLKQQIDATIHSLQMQIERLEKHKRDIDKVIGAAGEDDSERSDREELEKFVNEKFTSRYPTVEEAMSFFRKDHKMWSKMLNAMRFVPAPAALIKGEIERQFKNKRS